MADDPPARASRSPRRRYALLIGALALAGLIPAALLNREALARVLYARTLEHHLRDTQDAVLHWGPPEARLKVQAFLPFDCLCQGDRLRVLSEAARRHGSRLYVELVNMDSRLGARQFARSGLTCSGIFLNGRQKLRVRMRGTSREVLFSGAPAEESPERAHYTSEELQAAIDQEIARLYGGGSPSVPAGIRLPVASGEPSAGGRPPDLDAAAYDELARTLFAPVYPLLAKQIVEDYGITSGRCLDVGCGPAYLSCELARISELTITALDIDRGALALARANIRKAGLVGRVIAVEGDVQRLPFESEHFDLVISRCSLPCWPDKARAFGEIRRVLKPRGVAFIGMGSGRLLPAAERRRIVKALDELRREQGEAVPWLRSLPSTRFLRYSLLRAGIDDARITRTDDGLWIEFRKEPPRGRSPL